MNFSRLGWLFVISFAVIAAFELRWFVYVYGTDLLIPAGIFLALLLVGAAVLRRYVEPPTATAADPDR